MRWNAGKGESTFFIIALSALKMSNVVGHCDEDRLAELMKMRRN